uniref:SOCS box domain-containing protein n=1 Tax=Knipowitschia caucasica TaxID=637954 RepID=A0AAV2MLM5_KNICA
MALLCLFFPSCTEFVCLKKFESELHALIGGFVRWVSGLAPPPPGAGVRSQQPPSPSLLSRAHAQGGVARVSGAMCLPHCHNMDQSKLPGGSVGGAQRGGVSLEPFIHQAGENPRSLQHLCRLRIRRCLGRLRLRSATFMSFLPLPQRLKHYILFREYELYKGPD